MVIPIGDRFNQIVYLKVKEDGEMVDVRQLRPTLFVPMTGRALREAAEKKQEEQGTEADGARAKEGP